MSSKKPFAISYLSYIAQSLANDGGTSLASGHGTNEDGGKSAL